MKLFLQNKALAIAGILGVVFIVVLIFALGGQRTGNPEDVTGGVSGGTLPGILAPRNTETEPKTETSSGGQANQSQTLQLPKNWKPTDFSTNDEVVGTGAVVKSGDTVSVHYLGVLTTGQKFDSSRDRGEPFEFTVGNHQVIAGWEKGLIGMKVGGKRTLVIPPSLGYGDKAVGPIPANSTLIFEVELLAIKK